MPGCNTREESAADLARDEAEPAEPCCPRCGGELKGTVENVPGVALATFTRNADGTVETEYVGETEIDWDGQTTETLEDEPLVVCEHGCTFPETEIDWGDDEEEALQIDTAQAGA